LLAGTFTDTRTSQHSKFNFPRICDVRNCKYAPILLIKYDFYDGKNFRVTKVLKNISYWRQIMQWSVSPYGVMLAKKSGQGAVKFCQLLRFVIISVSTDLPHLYLEYLQVMWSCLCPCEVNVSLPRILRKLCVPITWLPPFLVISPSSFVMQYNETLHPRWFFRFG
jgi:hypothetical protein